MQIHQYIFPVLTFFSTAGLLTYAQTASASEALVAPANSRQLTPLSGPGWQFCGGKGTETLPPINSDAFKQIAWTSIEVPHIFQTRSDYDTVTKGWYRRDITVDPSTQGKERYLVFEGAASVADVYVNGQHLGQHRGSYARFLFDATKALHPGPGNKLEVLIDNSPENTLDCLPISLTGLYKVWGGLYRHVWLLETSPVHIDPTDYAAPGVYITPKDVSDASANLGIRVLVRNSSAAAVQAHVRTQILDPSGKEVKVLTAPAQLAANGSATVELSTVITQPQLWEPRKGRVYHVKTEVLVDGKPVDEVTEPTGFRWLDWDWKGFSLKVNGKKTILYGVNLHQETETKGSAVSEADLKANFETIDDLGINFLRLPHYPHARIEYDECDQHGILCWAENGHSNSKDIVGPTAAQITTELVKQNYNHPSIVIWSMGNESNPQVADQCVPIAKALDSTRPVGVANMKSELADVRTPHCYFGWYHKHMAEFKPKGWITEVGCGGLVTTHVDYNQADWTTNRYEPEEYQQLWAEYHYQQAFRGDNSQLGLFCQWILRDFSDGKYKAPVGWNTKGLTTYAGDKKDIYYLYRCFLRPEVPTIAITSKRYFLRQGAVDNGIKVYSNAPQVTLTLNGSVVSTLKNGQYVIPNGPWADKVEKKKKGATGPEPTAWPYKAEKADNVFYWPVPLHIGKNVVTATDDKGNSDSAIVYFSGSNGLPELPAATLPLSNLASSNANNPAHYMDMPVHAQWPLYYDFDSTADNSWHTLPSEVENAAWIALKRVTKPDQATTLSFTVTKPVTVYVITTKTSEPPTFVSLGQFKEISQADTLWRNNDLILVPTQLYAHTAAAGEKISLTLGDRDALVMIK